jgi:hypothetical protein
MSGSGRILMQGCAMDNTTPGRPLYASPCSLKNFYQRYEIFSDHIELHAILGIFKVPFSEIERAEVFPGTVMSLRLHLRNFRWRGMKLDFTDFEPHILLDKSSGVIRQLLFTPDDPQQFKDALDRAMEGKRKVEEV